MICWNAACNFRDRAESVFGNFTQPVNRPGISFAAKGGFSLSNAVSTRTRKILRLIREMIFEIRCKAEQEFFRFCVAGSLVEIHSPVAREKPRDLRIFFVISVLDLKRTLW
jgi:hypothetical protein